MRPATLLPLALIALAAGACSAGSDRAEQTAFQVPKRDLTLQQAAAPTVDVASTVELKPTPIRQVAVHQSRRTHRATTVAPRGVPAAHATPTPAPKAVTSPAPALPVKAASAEPPDPHALAPGQTITVLPVSAGELGAPPAPEPGDAGPADQRGGPSVQGGGGIGGGHGGSCGGRGGRHGGGGLRGALR